MGGISPVAGLSPLIRALVREAGAYPYERKVLVCPRRGVGRELLRRLSLVRGGWTQFEASTPRDLATELVTDALVERGLSVADEFDELELIDESIERATAEREAELLPFVTGAGLREAMANSIRALRLAGIDAAKLVRAGFRDRRKREAVGRVLDHYERQLLSRSRTDVAGVMRLAVSALEAGAVELPGARYYLLPGQSRRGLAGRVLELLARRGAPILEDDEVFGLPVPASLIGAAMVLGGESIPDETDQRTGSMLSQPGGSSGMSASRSPLIGNQSGEERAEAGLAIAGPAVSPTSLAWLHAVETLPSGRADGVELEIFSAGSVNDEIREVLRRVIDLGLRWGDVEVVATDPMAYGTALDVVARRLAIPVTYAAGLPLGRTRPGRVVEAYLRWVREGFPEDVLRELIERGDIASASGPARGPALARRMQRMLIGRGRERYEQALARATRAASIAVSAEYPYSANEMEEIRLDERSVLDDLRTIIGALFEPLPAMHAPPGGASPLVTPAQIALSLIACLSMVPVGDDGAGETRPLSVDRTAVERLKKRLSRLAGTATRPMSVDSAIAVIAAKLDARVPAPAADGVAPWTSAGGRLHLSDIDHGGWTGRAAVFVVGLDAGRFPGTTTHDTLLNDDDRRRLESGRGFAPVPTSGERVEERRHALASLLARQRGRVTLSYSAWEAAEARTVAPAPELLQAYRLMRRDPTLDYRRLHEDAFRRHASAIPRGGAHLDDADVWLAALTRDGVLVSGVDVVRNAYPGLDRGLRAMEARASLEFTAHHGRIAPRPGLDPRGDPDRITSPDRLETLGVCPHRYLLRHVLGARSPAAVEFAPDRWLTAADRGQLLHRVYKASFERAQARGHAVTDAAFEQDALDVLDEQIDRSRERLVPPGEAVFEFECESLRDEVRLFATMTRERGAPWKALELQFGSDLGGRGPVHIELPGGAIALRGRVDRVDEVDGSLVVIDYKTGSAAGYGRREGTFDGGRRLQHALYSASVRRLFGMNVSRAEYHFPTNRGEVQVASFEERSLRRARTIVDMLLDTVRAGHFFPTDDAADCRWCEYRAACRVKDGFREPDSPMAAWSGIARHRLPELRVLSVLREDAG